MNQLIWLLFSLPAYQGNLEMGEPIQKENFIFLEEIDVTGVLDLTSGCLHFCWQSLSPQAPAFPAASLSMLQTAPSSTLLVLPSHMEAILLPE